MDVTSDEDFLTQLSLDLDIPLYLNPGEDELNLLNSHFDKSPEEILSDIASPPYTMEDYTKEDNELKNIDFPTFSFTSLPHLQSNIKSECSNSSGSEKSNSPIQLDLQIKEEAQVKTPPLSPNSVVISTTGVKDFPNKTLYTQPVQILTPHLGKLTTVPAKQIPIIPKTQFPLSTKQNKVIVLNSDIKPVVTTPQPTKVLVVENVKLHNSIPHIKVESPTTVTTSVNVVPNVMVNTMSRFSTSTIDPRILKKQQRKIKNRESASLSRKRKKDYMTSLEDKVKELNTENKRLQMVSLEYLCYISTVDLHMF